MFKKFVINKKTFRYPGHLMLNILTFMIFLQSLTKE